MALFARSILAIGFALGLLAAAARAGEPSPPADKALGCDCCRMKAAGMTAAQMLACPMMQQCAKAGMPNALLAMKFKLGLSEEQVAKLNALVKKVQEDSLALLTDEQKNVLSAMPGATEPQPAPGQPQTQPQSQTQPRPQPQAQSAPCWRGCCGMMQGGGCSMMQGGGCMMGR